MARPHRRLARRPTALALTLGAALAMSAAACSGPPEPQAAPHLPAPAPPASPGRPILARASAALAAGDLAEARRLFTAAGVAARAEPVFGDLPSQGLGAPGPDWEVVSSGDGTHVAVRWSKELRVYAVGDWRELFRRSMDTHGTFVLSHDGSLVAVRDSAAAHGGVATLRLFRTATGEELAAIPAAAAPMVFTRDGRTLACVSHAAEAGPHLVLWDIAGRRARHSISVYVPEPGSPRYSVPVTSLRVSSRRGGVRAYFQSGLERTWDPETGALLRAHEGGPTIEGPGEFDGHLAGPKSGPRVATLTGARGDEAKPLSGPGCESADRLVFSDSGAVAVTAAGNRRVCVWDVAEQRLSASFETRVSFDFRPADVEITPDGLSLLVTDDLGKPPVVRLQSLAKGDVQAELPSVKRLRRDPDAVVFVDPARNELVRVPGAERIQRIPLPGLATETAPIGDDKVSALAWRVPERRAQGPREGQYARSEWGLLLLDTLSGKTGTLQAEKGHWILSYTDGPLHVFGSGHRGMRVWDGASHAPVLALDRTLVPETASLRFSADGAALELLREGAADRLVVASSAWESVPFPRLDSAQPGGRAPLVLHTEEGETAALFDESSPRLALTRQDRSVVLKPAGPSPVPGGYGAMGPLHLRLSRDGKGAAVIFGEAEFRDVRYFDTTTGKQLHRFTEPYSPLDTTLDGRARTLAVAGGSTGLAVYDLGTGKKLFSSDVTVTSHALAPDGARLAAVSYGDLHLWEPASGKHVCKREALEYVQPVFSRDGSLLASAEPHRFVLLDRDCKEARSIPWSALGGPEHARDRQPAFSFSPGGDLISIQVEAAATIFRVRDGQALVHLRVGPTYMAAFLGGKVQLLGPSEETSALGRCRTDGWELPLPFCLPAAADEGLLARALGGR